MRLKDRPSAVAKLRAIRVLPRPGKSSNRTCPPASAVAMTISSSGRLPTTPRSTSAITFLQAEETSSTPVTALLHERLEIIHDAFRIGVQRRLRGGREAIARRRKIHERIVQPGIEVLLDRLIGRRD